MLALYWNSPLLGEKCKTFYVQKGIKKRKEALVRLDEVKNHESDIKKGTSFKFPWMSDKPYTTVSLYKLDDAVNQWLSARKKNKIREKTIEINRLSLKYFIEWLGKKRPLNSINNLDIENYVSLLDSKGHSDTTVNIHLRTVKSMLRYYHKVGKMDCVPLIEQRKIDEKDPIYITNDEFQLIIELNWLDKFYKRVFFFYRETGLRLREPFMAILDGDWLDIPTKSKNHKSRSIELTTPLAMIYAELYAWCNHGYGSSLVNPGDHMSKLFKKALRCIGADENKRFHSLRHTFAVRMVLQRVPIYEIMLLMGHKTVTTTERYAKMNLKRVKQDFSSLNRNWSNGENMPVKIQSMKNTGVRPDSYMHTLREIAV